MSEVDEERCLHDMVRGTCTLCQERAATPHRVTDAPGGFRRGSSPTQRASTLDFQGTETIPARFPGYCRECRSEISIGDPISRSPGTDEWVHSECL